jgi:hypothetical protein
MNVNHLAYLWCFVGSIPGGMIALGLSPPHKSTMRANRYDAYRRMMISVFSGTGTTPKLVSYLHQAPDADSFICFGILNGMLSYWVLGYCVNWCIRHKKSTPAEIKQDLKEFWPGAGEVTKP